MFSLSIAVKINHFNFIVQHVDNRNLDIHIIPDEKLALSLCAG